MEPDKVKYWVYWGMASLTAAFIGGLVFPWLQRNDPLKLGDVVRSAGNAVT